MIEGERSAIGRRAAAAAALAAITIAPSAAWAQVDQGTSPLTFVVVLGLLALLPFLLMLVTSFVKIAVVLSLLRTAIGAQQVPPSQVITGLAIILSIYVMAPVISQTYEIVEPAAVELEASGADVTPSFALDLAPRAAAPLKEFLLRHADPAERLLLHELAVELRAPEDRADLAPDDFLVAIPAFVLTELKEAFTIGFMLFVPFLIVDLVVANILLSLGMHMLSPTTISLPFKLLLFVLVDGWYLVIKGLLLGYA